MLAGECPFHQFLQVVQIIVTFVDPLHLLKEGEVGRNKQKNKNSI